MWRVLKLCAANFEFLDAAHQEEDDQDHDDQSQAAGGVIAPAAAVGPGGDSSDQQQDQDDQQNGSHLGTFREFTVEQKSGQLDLRRFFVVEALVFLSTAACPMLGRRAVDFFV